MVYQLANPNNNQHLTKYNEICSRDYSQFDEKLSLHHILSRSKFPELKNDKQNHAWLPTLIHVEAHYHLWKYNPIFALEFWFPLVYFRKRQLFDVTPEEYQQLKKDLAYCKKLKKDGLFEDNYKKIMQISS